jgi:hypothetical protein
LIDPYGWDAFLDDWLGVDVPFAGDKLLSTCAAAVYDSVVLRVAVTACIAIAIAGLRRRQEYVQVLFESSPVLTQQLGSFWLGQRVTCLQVLAATSLSVKIVLADLKEPEIPSDQLLFSRRGGRNPVPLTTAGRAD